MEIRAGRNRNEPFTPRTSRTTSTYEEISTMKCNCEDIETLLSGYLDGELTQSDRQRVEVLMEDCEDCAKTFEEMKKLRGEISGIEYEHMTEADRLKAVKDPVAQTGASLGQILVIGGFIFFYGSCIYLALKEMLSDPDTPHTH